ncbi:hypothetical protein [Niabella sp.]|uniref:hypothetical protein n=1 Tax=Niabella sp. TaxID=1962976 RepID=UPI00263519C7|nr:hypothetical protein [Niabella sp.]
MSLFYTFLDEQIKLLKEKGYDEKSINSPNTEGVLFSELRRNFSFALHQSYSENNAVDFSIDAIGYFNEHKDVICFKFNYQFDPNKCDLSIKNIELLSASIHCKIPIQSPKDIPHSSEAPEILLNHHKIRPRQMDSNFSRKSENRIRRR